MYPISYELRHEYPSEKEGVFLPVLLEVGSERVLIDASVDTGASYCLFARSVAESLGIEVESGHSQRFSTANGVIEAFGHSVHLMVLGIEVDAVVFFFANSAIQKNLLGRRGWLDRVRFGIEEYERMVYLSRYEAS